MRDIKNSACPYKWCLGVPAFVRSAPYDYERRRRRRVSNPGAPVKGVALGMIIGGILCKALDKLRRKKV